MIYLSSSSPKTKLTKLSSFDDARQAPVEAGDVKPFIFVLLLVITIFLILIFGKK